MFDLEKTETAVFNLYALFYAMRDSAEILDEDSLPKHREIIIAFEKIADEQLKVIQENISSVETAPDNMYSLPQLLTEVLDYQRVPNEIYNAVRKGLHEVAEKSGFKSLEAVEISEKYISNILSDYEEVRNRNEQ